MANTKKDNGNRYSAVDSVPWVVRDTNGNKVGKDSYTGYKEAESAANTYRIATGLYADASRS